jgi:hypothetical protein
MCVCVKEEEHDTCVCVSKKKNMIHVCVGRSVCGSIVQKRGCGDSNPGHVDPNDAFYHYNYSPSRGGVLNAAHRRRRY